MFTIEYAIFGDCWLTFNPPPFIVKPAIAYILIAFEGILLLLSGVLYILGIYSQTKMKLFSIIAGTFLTAIYVGILYYFPL